MGTFGKIFTFPLSLFPCYDILNLSCMKGGLYLAVHKSGEDYLEAILMIRQEKGFCRSIDVAHHLNVSKPSVSVAMGQLRDNGMITTDASGLLDFTEKGYELASTIYQRHCLLTKFFRSLGVSDAVAQADACKIEHDISEETFQCFKRYLQEHASESDQ